jgi:hypothetical protein
MIIWLPFSVCTTAAVIWLPFSVCTTAAVPTKGYYQKIRGGAVPYFFEAVS